MVRIFRSVRFFQELSQEEVARRACVSQTVVSKAERGMLPDTPAARRAKLRIACVLGVIPEDENLEPKA